jgi:hypothetical protein
MDNSGLNLTFLLCGHLHNRLPDSIPAGGCESGQPRHQRPPATTIWLSAAPITFFAFISGPDLLKTLPVACGASRGEKSVKSLTFKRFLAIYGDSRAVTAQWFY